MIYVYLLIAIIFFAFMTFQNLWKPTSTLYSKIFISLVWPATLAMIAYHIILMKQQQNNEE